MFLAVVRKTVIDVHAVAADPDATPPVVAVAEVSHEEVEQTYVEDSATQVAANIANGLDIDYYDIIYGATLRPSLKKVREKGRAAAPARETVTIENTDGLELGSAVV